jgi:choline dehydrogenase-like flavoprotein
MAIATEQYDGRDKCINLGACGMGCAQGAKASTDITYWPHAIRAGVKLKTHCRVREITVDKAGKATGAIYYDADGNEQFQPAELVVMACNGIGTPRILLNSSSAQFPDGLGNSSGMVGKNLMFHPYAAIEGIFRDALDGAKGPHKCVASHEFYETNLERGFLRGFSFETQRGYGPAATALRGVFTGRVPKGEGHHAAYGKMSERGAGRHMRGLTRASQSGDSRPRIDRCPRDSSAKNSIYTQRKQSKDVGLCRGARHRGIGGCWR